MLTRRITFGALLIALAGVGLVTAQQEPPPPPGGRQAQQRQQAPQGQQGQQAPQAQTIRAKQILGSMVNIQGEKEVGKVDDIVLDDHGNVDYLIVANSDGKLVTVPWDAVRFNVDKRLAMVHIAPEQFQQVPTYTAEQYPAFATPAYRTQVYSYYGLTPGQQRRAMRRGVIIR